MGAIEIILFINIGHSGLAYVCKIGYKVFMRILLIMALLMVLAPEVYAQSVGEVTKMPIPRFVSMRGDQVFARTGPGTRYPIKWVFQRKNLPVEIVQEFDTWRKIRDIDGEEGWVHQSLLSGKRFGVLKDGQAMPLSLIHI